MQQYSPMGFDRLWAGWLAMLRQGHLHCYCQHSDQQVHLSLCLLHPRSGWQRPAKPPPPLSLLQVTALQRQIADVDAQIQEAQKYLKMADPDGYYVEGSAAAEAAKAQAQRAAREEQMRRQEAQRQQRLKLVGVALAPLMSAGRHHVPPLIRHASSLDASLLLIIQADLWCSQRLVKTAAAIASMQVSLVCRDLCGVAV